MNSIAARRTPSSARLADEVSGKDNHKVKELEAVKMLQDIFLKADNRELQAEVLNRMFKIFSSHLENYKLCPAVTDCSTFHPKYGRFSSIFARHTFKNSRVSFDQQYNKVLREVGVLEILLDELKQHKLLSVDCEKQVIQLLFELALEIVLPPFLTSESVTSPDVLDYESSSCIELLLETSQPFLLSSSPILKYALEIVEVLGAYRLSASELRMLIRYVLQMRLMKSGRILVDMMERLILMADSENISLAP
ncbi:hypothetical protein L3X38_045071 [Prunus dulcis]|uniref:Uncharacterized protein n=1 Tax=Prunus dulcis TaxID=3755 RepID=A0AAD4YNV0_PRUDU|nr:hypothetical protein L3X38_045071 [Prunus dulcis]